MDIRQYLSSSYEVLKNLFVSCSTVEQSILLGTVREFLIAQLLRFFPEPVRSGWIYDEQHNYSGQIDLILNTSKALKIPSLVVGENSVSGTFANQVFSTIEVKSNISASINEIICKVWECHRLIGGFGNQTTETFGGVKTEFEFKNWIPVCVVGSSGFKNPEKYQEHFDGFSKLSYSINKKTISSPTNSSQVAPDVLVDLEYNTVVIHNSLHPELIKKCFNLNDNEIVKMKDCSIFPSMKNGRPLMILLYYLDTFRGDVSICQLTNNVKLLDLFKP